MLRRAARVATRSIRFAASAFQVVADVVEAFTDVPALDPPEAELDDLPDYDGPVVTPEASEMVARRTIKPPPPEEPPLAGSLAERRARRSG